MDQQLSDPLPDFENPPVIEVVYGVQFQAKPDIQTPTIGLFWQKIRKQYPQFKEMAPLNSIVEEFGLEGKPENIGIELLSKPPLPRLFFIDPTENWILQLQSDRLLHNWRQIKETDSYPRYQTVSKKFLEAWESFLSFCADERLSPPSINQLELTYINHIPIKERGTPFKDIEKIFPDLRWRERHSFLSDPETLSWKTSFVLPNQEGRLHVSLRHAFRRKDKIPVLLFELTARGMPRKSDKENIEKWFALGREWIVRAFADLTDPAIQKEFWGRKE